MQDFVEILLAECERQNMSLNELARRAGCGRPYLHRVIHGDQIPTLAWVEKISRVLGVSIKFAAPRR